MLLVAQIAVAIVLLAGASLAVRSLSRLWRVDSGFKAEQTMTFGFVMRESRYPKPADIHGFADRAYSSLEHVPGVAVAGMTTHLPLGDNNFENAFTVEGAPVDTREPPVAGVRFVLGRYVEAIGARVLEGRSFAPTDSATSQPVAIVTSDFARRYIPSGRVVGARVKIGLSGSDDPWRTIVGVIADIHHAGLDQPTRPEVWMPHSQLPDDLMVTWLRGMNAVVRTNTDPDAVVPSLRAAMRDADPELPLIKMRSMTELELTSTAERRLETSLLAAYAAIALGLSGIGLFGVLAFHVSQHVQEFGVRLALGATPRNLLAGVLRRAMLALVAGLGLGIPGALLMGHAMSALLYDVAPYDPVALGGATLAMALVTLAASALPARRAMRTDPLTAIRAE
jgi:predicted permease